MSSLADTIQRMQIQQLESMIAEADHKARKAKAEADLAELILKRVSDSEKLMSLPRSDMS